MESLSVVLFAVVASVALGTALGLYRGARNRTFAPIHTFALVAALAVVLAQMLPAALSVLGLQALAVFGLAMLAPGLLEKLADRGKKPGRPSIVGLELGYWGLLAHRVADGLALGSLSSSVHAGHHHHDVFFAISVHSVPVVALLVLTYQSRRNTAVALFHAIGLAAATIAGALATRFVESSFVEHAEPWIAAVAAGLLLHVVGHGFKERGSPTTGGRVLEMIAIGGGICWVSLGGAGHEGQAMRAELGSSLAELALQTAPSLLLGLGIAAALQTFGTRLIPFRWLTTGTPLTQAVRGAVLGAPLPVCSCGVLPVAQSLRARGAHSAVVVAFLLATPEIGVETFALTVTFLGWSFAWVRLGAAMAVAIIAALLVKAYATQHEPSPDKLRERAFSSAPPSNQRSWWNRLLSELDELLYHIGPWTLVGLIVAAYLHTLIPEGGLVSLHRSGFDVILVSLAAMPSYVCAASATPLAAVLLLKGMSPGAVLAGLLLGPATNIATAGWLHKTFGKRAAVVAFFGLLAATWSIAYAFNWFGTTISAQHHATHLHEPGIGSYSAALVLAILVLRNVWQGGLWAWLSSLRESLATTTHPHEHGDSHDHAHSHDHGHCHDHEHSHAHAHL